MQNNLSFTFEVKYFLSDTKQIHSSEKQHRFTLLSSWLAQQAWWDFS